MMNDARDISLLEDFEKGLDPRHPERSAIPAPIIGYGEMSTIFEINTPSLKGYAFKRMPIFRSTEELDRYENLFHEYNRLINDDIGIHVPGSETARILPGKGNMVVYILQEKLPPQSICDRVIKVIDDDSILHLVTLILREMKKVWDYNGSGGAITIGFDGQISNWAIRGYEGSEPPRIDEETRLSYIDTSTPLMSRNGVERLNPDLFLRSAPSFLVWLIKWFFLEDVMTRYYDFHLVAVDLVANFYKEQRPDIIPSLIKAVNIFFESEAPELDVEPINEKEVRSYYREDAFIWSLYLNLRRFDRFLHTRIMRKPYTYILPGTIDR
ncbi:MAG: hypothetical protein E4H39_00050 [Syntrophobacterales bacterium]|nr:MAG: hypothetical protein E4H39_00050 [Syntrophobacterales bacterium]